MSGPKPTFYVEMTPLQSKLLKKLSRRHKIAQCLLWRIRIVFLAAKGFANTDISRWTGKDRGTVCLWRKR